MTAIQRKIIVEANEGAAAARAAELFMAITCEAIAQRGRCSVALAGGTTPRLMYEHLAREGLSGRVNWQQVAVFFGDERDVKQDDADSNYRMVQRALLDHVPINLANVFPMPADAEDLAAASRQYEQRLRQEVGDEGGGVPRLDLVLLGMGADGHTASLFPGTPALNEQARLVTAQFVPVLGRKRMTFTLGLINAARNVLLLVTGADKAQAVASVLSEPPGPSAALPAGRVAPAGGSLIMILDEPAARMAKVE
jgi:6-phosphogluconolactonase